MRTVSGERLDQNGEEMKSKRMSIKEFTQPRVEATADSIMAVDWTHAPAYADFLAQTFYHIQHSTRLLAAAAARFPAEQENLHLHCLKHAGEERSHEKLSLSDLKTVGYALDDFPELPATKSLYRSAYYLIEHVNPVALFGYAYFLEWIAVAAGGRMIPVVEPVYGKKGIKHLHVHTNEDPAHIEGYEELLDTFSGAERDCLLESVATTAADYERLFHEVAARSSRGALRRAG
jgi:hypothetical protein